VLTCSSLHARRSASLSLTAASLSSSIVSLSHNAACTVTVGGHNLFIARTVHGRNSFPTASWHAHTQQPTERTRCRNPGIRCTLKAPNPTSISSCAISSLRCVRSLSLICRGKKSISIHGMSNIHLPISLRSKANAKNVSSFNPRRLTFIPKP